MSFPQWRDAAGDPQERDAVEDHPHGDVVKDPEERDAVEHHPHSDVLRDHRVLQDP